MSVFPTDFPVSNDSYAVSVLRSWSCRHRTPCVCVRKNRVIPPELLGNETSPVEMLCKTKVFIT